MKDKSILLPLLESVLEKGTPKSKGNYAFVCPFHVSNPPGKKNFEIQLETDEHGNNCWHCWGCDKKGKTVKSLFKQLKVNPNKIKELNLILTPNLNKPTKQYNTIPDKNEIKLPDEFISLINIENLPKVSKIEAKQATIYLKKRGIYHNDIIKYNIGFCEKGKYEGRIIIPSYNSKGELNYFIARTYKDAMKKYQNPPISADIIGLELFINWNAPIIIVEGIFDALTIKRNAIPLFGKIIHQTLMKKIVKSDVDKIYICLDKDAIKKSIEYAEQLLNLGKKVYLVEINEKDINQIGYTKFLNILEKTQPLTFSKLIQIKLNLIL